MAVVKGLELMINSTGELKKRGADVELLLIGDGPARQDLENLVSDLGLHDRIRFLGQRNIKEIAAFSRAADLFVMSSHSEGIPTAMLEAITFGLPILSTAVGGIPSLVIEGVNACLVHDRSVDSYANELQRALMLDKKTAAVRGRDHIRTRFSAQSVVAKMDDVMAQTIGLQGRPH